MTPKPFSESAVLAPRDPSLTSSDDWPEFRLSDVVVTLPGSALTEPTSLLVASEHNPVTVTGKLEPIPANLTHSYLLSGKQKRPVIEVADVKSYAYGAYEDGSVELWAAGGAGWFEINPSKAFRHVYEDMTEAVNVLFFVVDAYQTPRKTGKGRNAVRLPDYAAKELFEKYAIEVLGDRTATKQAMDTIHKHRDFLISSMLTGKEGMSWSANPLYKHLYQKFPGEFAHIKRRIAGPEGSGKKSQPTASHVRQNSVESTSTSSSLRRRRGRPPKNALSTDAISMESSSVVNAVAKDASADGQPVKPLTKNSKVGSRSTRQHHRNAKSSAPPSGIETPEVPESQPEAQDSDTDSHAHRQKRKSGLRLKPNQSAKGLPKSNKLALGNDEEDPEPRSSPIQNGKRKRDDLNTHSRHSKRRSSRYEVDEGIDIPGSPSSDEIIESPDVLAGATDTSLPLRLNHRPDPVQEDTWICALDGCTHKVYAASLPESQKLIREHYALHAYDDDERVQLVKTLEAPSMPVNHLMDKIRMQARLEGFPGSRVAGTRFPDPLRTRY